MSCWRAKKQTQAGTNQGKWVVYRPDGLRFVACESRLQAMQLAYMLRIATESVGGDWQKMLTDERERWSR